jgi:hypothetical protein
MERKAGIYYLRVIYDLAGWIMEWEVADSRLGPLRTMLTASL